MFAELRANGRDPNELLAILASKSRDNGRTPMQGCLHNAGFTEGEPWDWRLRQLRDGERPRGAGRSRFGVLYLPKSLIRLRKTLPVLTCDYQIRSRNICSCGVIAASRNPWWLTSAISLMNGNLMFSAVMAPHTGPHTAALRPFEASGGYRRNLRRNSSARLTLQFLLNN